MRFVLATVVVLVGAAACDEADDTAIERSCRFTEADLLGGWSTPAGDEVVANDVREFDFEISDGDRTVREYLHHRPMGSGTWTFEACQVLVTYREGGTEAFRLEGDTDPLLVGNPGEAQDRTVYTKVADAVD